MADRVLVFGRPARLLADIRRAGWADRDLWQLRASIQEIIRLNRSNGALQAP